MTESTVRLPLKQRSVFVYKFLAFLFPVPYSGYFIILFRFAFVVLFFLSFYLVAILVVTLCNSTICTVLDCEDVIVLVSWEDTNWMNSRRNIFVVLINFFIKLYNVVILEDGWKKLFVFGLACLWFVFLFLNKICWTESTSIEIYEKDY